ncbi:MAG: prolipoprotein diacylglyceryl transferase [Lachnospiraceae bacterium]|nr:prolipoprotein diacylglyceryl transferase [Lachnospiraceae bacterium]MBR5667842.1 prolipoprotein diacylglyceryl transferase [Lachnospiraceae bacterium]
MPGLQFGFTDIGFPNLGLYFKNVRDSITVFDVRIAFYGIIIGLGMILGYLVAEWTARRTGQDPEKYLDFTIIAIVISVACARLYYVIFNWKSFSDNPASVFNLRTGGLAIYGGVIGGVTTAIVFAKIKKLNIGQFLDTAILGLLTGQVIGRWGNFFNRECFGTYTDSLFAMRVDVTDAAMEFNPATSIEFVNNMFAGKPQALENVMKIRENAIVTESGTFIQVHPTFLYESLWNLALLVLLILYTKHKKFHSEIFLLYLVGYGIGRFWIEGLRTDQLFLFNTSIPVSQALSALLAVLGALLYGILFLLNRKKKAASEGKND